MLLRQLLVQRKKVEEAKENGSNEVLSPLLLLLILILLQIHLWLWLHLLLFLQLLGEHNKIEEV